MRSLMPLTIPNNSTDCLENPANLTASSTLPSSNNCPAVVRNLPMLLAKIPSISLILKTSSNP